MMATLTKKLSVKKTHKIDKVKKTQKFQVIAYRIGFTSLKKTMVI